MKIKFRFFITLFGVVLSILSFSSYASYISIDAETSGWYRFNGSDGAPSSEANYLAGNYGPYLYSNWFVFDLSDISDDLTIVSATLTLYSGSISSAGTYYLVDVTTDISNLITGTAGVDGYNDLNTGSAFGDTELDITDAYQSIDIELDTNAIIDSFNDSTSLWAVGGYYVSSGYAFGNTNAQTATLAVEVATTPVPEPTPFYLFILSAVLLTFWQYKYKRKSE